ncbi:MAG: hypothetical protein Q7J44_20695 [Pseudotabrizicola sp.]|uniref:hypothetical protein n=1 Tax=Pseudotabrizicola sp. TaxID=2939647 RepID=UPI00272645B0|nr:hypothetical protein [Pseudotabrizicola sp.]MDO9640958.1 hypothetical protein [Pseudotabrizicola sp.]
MTQRLPLAAALTLCLAGAGWAFDGVTVEGILPDADFFRAATCGAAPGQDCRQPPVTWGKQSLTLAVVPSDAQSGLLFRMLLSASVDYAIAQINGAGSALSITRIAGPEADIRLSLTDATDGSQIAEVPGMSGAGVMGVGYATLWWTPDHKITEASILISTSITPGEIVSVVLEEIFQATGPVFDIDAAAYEGVSILSQTSNATVTIAGQDARLLRHLYPPEP